MNRWGVIGAGPCGIAAVGALVDLGIKVTWIDPSFRSGRMGLYYREVPANTTITDLITALRACKSFGFENSQELRKSKGQTTISDLIGRSTYCSLGPFVDTLEDATENLLASPMVTKVQSIVTCVTQKDDFKWELTLDGNIMNKVEVDAIVFSSGSVPKRVSKTSVAPAVHYSMDRMVCPRYVQTLLTTTPSLVEGPWLVAGSSHSAMLIIKNLLESGAKRIVNVHRGEMRFMHTTEAGWVKFEGTGLKGPVAAWVKANIPSPAVERVKWDAARSWGDYVDEYGVVAAVFAIGFEVYRSNDECLAQREIERDMQADVPFPRIFLNTNNRDELTGDDLAKYDIFDGEIKQLGNLFGTGMAFPPHQIDGGGNIEELIGFHRTIKQMAPMLKRFNMRKQQIHE